MTDVPQVLVNTRVKVKKELSSIPGYAELVERINDSMKGEGRIFVRCSGTEPVVRVLVEGADRKRIAQYAEEIASFLQVKLGQ
jgi:phosphoglucosamine mutase